MVNLTIFINILTIILCSNRFLIQESKENRTLKLQSFEYTTIGRKGTLLLFVTTDSYVFPLNYEKNTSFEIKISDEYKSKCGISYIFPYNIIFCLFDESIPAGKYIINIEGFFFETDKYIYSWDKYSNRQIYVYKLDKALIDLYSNEQKIVIDKKENEDTNSYFLKFNISSYNNERIFVLINTILDNCKKQKNELVCPITRNQILATGQYKLTLYFLNEKNELSRFWLVPDIQIEYLLPRETIYVGITKLIENIRYQNSYVVYETNVTDIKNIRPNSIGTLSFETEDGTKKSNQVCTLRKYDNTPLYLLCQIFGYETFRLSEIKEEKKLYIDPRYNFVIPPTNNKELIYFNEKGGFIIKWVYPEILDFTKKDTWTIEYYSLESERINGLTLNEDVQDLSCETGDKIIKCIVPKSHFKGKKNGFYFTKYRNVSDGKSIFYEIPPIKVILSKSDSDLFGKNISLSFIYSFILLFLILF